jgi:hypothetical protein
MAVRAEDIVRNSEVSARVRAGPPARAVPRVTDALKSATFEPQCHDRPLQGRVPPIAVRQSAAMKRHSPAPLLGRSDVGSTPTSGHSIRDDERCFIGRSGQSIVRSLST